MSGEKIHGYAFHGDKKLRNNYNLIMIPRYT